MTSGWAMAVWEPVFALASGKNDQRGLNSYSCLGADIPPFSSALSGSGPGETATDQHLNAMPAGGKIGTTALSN